MRGNLKGAVVRLAVFLIVCGLGTFALMAIFAQLRFQDKATYLAEFVNVSGLRPGDFVRIAGVEVGKVAKLSIEPNSRVLAEFTTDNTVVLTGTTKAVIRYKDLIGGRYLALEEGTGVSTRMSPGATIPIERTSPALDLDALIGGFRPLFRALDPDQVNALSSQLIAALQNQGATWSSFFENTAVVTSTLADRDQLIGQVIVNLNVVLGSLGDQSSQFAKTVDSLAKLTETLAGRKKDIANSLAYGDAAAATFADLLSQARPPLPKVVHETDRTAGTIMADKDYFDNLLATLPDAYKVLGRQGLYGDFFSFYLCDLVLKVNGKGGQPVYIKVAGQDTGRCTPR
jgi:phospholipid/cholesterol/gamma-HCH transport system substrate-binding protein